MKYILPFLLAILVVSPAFATRVAGSAIANTGTGSGSGVTTAAINSTGANTCIVGATQSGGSGSLTVSDSAGNTWIAVSGSPLLTNGSYLYVWYAKNVTTSSTHTATTAGASASFITTSLDCFSGESTTSPLRGSSTYSQSSYVQGQTGATVTASAGDDIWSYCSDMTNGGAETFSSLSLTLGSQATGGGSNQYLPGFTQYSNSVAAGSVTGAWTTSNFVVASSIIVDFGAGAGGSSNATMFLSN